MEDKAEDKKLFDVLVTHRDPKTGLVVRQDPYILRVTGEQGSDQKARMWERPAGSGNLFDKQNNPIGRWIYEEKVVKGKKVRVGKYDSKAQHIGWEAPLTQDQKIAKENASLKARVAELEKASIEMEQKKKDKGA